jgi:hypothetical protein
VTVISTAFAPLARVTAEGVGRIALPMVVVPHPVGDRDEALVQRRGEEIAALCAQLLTTPVERLEREFRDKKFPLPDALMPR